MLQHIKRAAENDWRVAAEWLKLTFAADYRRPNQQTNVEFKLCSAQEPNS
jgi:hypothetical protein